MGLPVGLLSNSISSLEMVSFTEVVLFTESVGVVSFIVSVGVVSFSGVGLLKYDLILFNNLFNKSVNLKCVLFNNFEMNSPEPFNSFEIYPVPLKFVKLRFVPLNNFEMNCSKSFDRFDRSDFV